MLHSILYRSEAALAGTGPELDQQILAIVEASRVRNCAAGLSGALMITSNSFVQVLEGPLAAVEATFERICRDLRHRRLELLEFTSREERLFGNWSMAQIVPSGELIRLVAGLEMVRDARADTADVKAISSFMRSVIVPVPRESQRR